MSDKDLSFGANADPAVTALAELTRVAKGLVSALRVLDKASLDQLKAGLKDAGSAAAALEATATKSMNVVKDRLEKGGVEAGKAAGKGVAEGIAQGAKGVAESFRALLGSGEIRKATEQVKREIKGHYDSLGRYVQEGTQALDKVASVNPFRSLLGSGEIRKATEQAKREIKGHYDSLGRYVQEGTQALDKVASANPFRSLLGSGEIRKATEQAKREIKGHYDSLGTFIQGEARKLASRTEMDNRNALRLGNFSAGSGLLDTSRLKPTGSYNSLGVFVPAIKPAADAGVAITGAGTAIQRFGTNLAAAEPRVKALTSGLNDMHSAARGAASGFGAMWLTWGALAPLLAGAAVSNAFVQSIKKGSEFAHTIESIGALAEQTEGDLVKLKDAALKIGSDGAFGPLQVAEGLKTLALAGLTAQQQLEAIPAVKIFATVGETDLKSSAETLVAVSTAYGYAAKDYGIVADIVAKTAASSMASVQDMAQAFRQASVVGQQYGVSLKDTALNLAMLAQIGIKGSAAGTSMRNMYTELMGSSERARKILKEVLKVDAWDNAAKSMRPIGELMRDMAGALAKMDTEKQQEALNKLGSERGTKNLAANLVALRTTYEGLGYTATNVFDKIVEDIDKAPGYAAQAAALMAGSTKNLMKSVSSSLEKSLISAFDETEPAVQRLAMLMKEAFGSKEFQEAVSGAAGSVASLITLLVEHADKLLWVAKAYISYQVGAVAAAAATLALGRAVAVGSAMMGLATALRSATLAMVAGGAASQVLAAGMGIMGPTATGAAAGVGILRTALISLQTAAPWLLAIAAALAAASWAWGKLSESGEEDGKKAGASLENLVASRKQLMGSIEEETQRLRVAAGFKEENLSAEERQAKVEQTLAKGRIDKIYKERDELLQLQADLRKTAAVRIEAATAGTLDEMGNVAPWASAASDSANAKLQAELKSIEDQRRELAGERVLDYMEVDNMTNLAIAAHKRAEDERKKARKATPSGTERPDMTFGRGAGGASAAQALRDNEIKELEKQYATNLKRVEDFTSSRKQILDAARSAEAISQATFAGRELDLTQSTEMEKLAVINSSGQLVLAAYDKAQKELGDQLSAAKKPQDREKLSQAMQNLLNSRDTFVNKLDADQDAVENSVFARVAKVALQAQGEIRKLGIEARDFAESEANRVADRRAAAEFEGGLQGLPDFTVAVLRAEREERTTLLNIDRERTKAIEEQQRAIEDFDKASRESYEYLLNGDQLSKEAVDTLAEMNKVLAERVRLRSELRGSAAGKIDAAGQDAAGVELSKLGDFDLASAFDAAQVSVGGLNIALGGTLGAMLSLTKQQELYEKARAGAGNDPKKLAKVELDNIKAQVKGTGDLLGATKTLFKEKTGAYKALDAAEKAYRVASMVMGAQEFALKMGWITAETALKVTSEGIKSGAEATGTTTSLALTGQRTAAKGVEALVAQLTLPFPANIPAFALVAAMLAALGVAVGGMGGGGSAKPDPGNLGTGTVLGDADAESESIVRSLELLESLESLSRVQIAYTKQMADRLGNLVDGIGGVAGLVTRNGSTSSAYNGVAQGTSLSSLGKIQGIGSAIGGLGGFALGSSVGLIGSALGPLGAIGGMVLGPLLDKVIGKLFNTKVKVTGSGLYAGAQDLGSIMDGGLLGVQGYADVNKKKKAFGITYSDKNSTQYSNVDPETKQQFSAVLRELAATTALAGGGLMGNNTEAAQKRLESYVVNLGKINLQGLNGEQVKERMTAIFSAEGDKMAAYLMPAIRDLQAVGEGALETLVRYSSTLAVVNDTLEILGNTMYNSSLGGAKLAMTLSEAFGGIEKYSASMSTYYENYYSEGERNAKTTQRLTAALKSLGFELPATMADYRKMVDDFVAGGGLLSESGASVYAELITLSEPFADLSESVRDAKEAVIDAAKGIMEYVNDLKGNRGGLATPLQQLQAARSNYVSDLTLAKGGDAEAMARLTNRADEYISAQKEVTASSSTTQAVIDQIIAELTQVATGVPAFAKGGMHAGGWAVVGEQGPELAYFSAPARIYDANTSAGMMGGANAELVQEVRTLREEVRGLRTQQAQETAVLVNSNLAAQEQAANVVVQGVSEASERAAWVQQTQPVIK